MPSIRNFAPSYPKQNNDFPRLGDAPIIVKDWRAVDIAAPVLVPV